MTRSATIQLSELTSPERQVLEAIREVSFGGVEAVIHEGRITEVRQTRRMRSAGEEKNPIGQPKGNEPSNAGAATRRTEPTFSTKQQ